MVEQLPPSKGSKVVIEVWADLACPWCYVAKHRLQTAIEQRPDADRFEIVMRSFELDPSAPHEPETNEQTYLRSHGGTAADLLRLEQQMQRIARAEGLDYSIERLTANTFNLHRVVQYAVEQGHGFEFFSRVQDGFFTGTLNPFARDALAEVAESVGLDGQRIREILANDEYAERVHTDRHEALEMGASGVPFIVFDRRLAAPGAQKVPAYGQLLAQVAGPVPSGSAA